MKTEAAQHSKENVAGRSCGTAHRGCAGSREVEQEGARETDVLRNEENGHLWSKLRALLILQAEEKLGL